MSEVQDIASGWTVLRWTGLEVSVTLKRAEYEPTKVTVTAEPDEHNAVLLALPLFPGAGPQPENTIIMQNVSDQAQQMINSLVIAIAETFNKEESKESKW